MRKCYYLLVLLILPVIIHAQDVKVSADNSQFKNNSYTGSRILLGTEVPGFIKPIDVHVETGASFGSLGFGGNYFQSFVSPSLSLPLNKNLSVSAGVTYSHTNFNNLPFLRTNGEFNEYSGSLNTLTMHTSGIYKASDKLTLTGSAFRSINPSFNSRLNPQALQMEAKGFSFGVDYKLGENTHIGAEIRYQQGSSNFLSPHRGYYSPSSLDSPFINNFGFPSGY